MSDFALLHECAVCVCSGFKSRGTLQGICRKIRAARVSKHKARSPKAEPEAFQIELLTLRGCLEGPMKALLRGSIRVLGLGSGFGV